MAIVAQWSGNGLTAGSMTTDSVGSRDTALNLVSPGVTIESAGARSPRILFTNPSGGAECIVVWSFPSQTAGAGRVYLTTPSALPASGQIPYFLECYSDAARVWSMDFTSTGRFNLRDNTAVIQQGASGMVQPSTTYRVEWTFDSSSRAITVNIFEGESTTVWLTLSGLATAAPSHNMIRIGRMNGANVNPYSIDDLSIANTAEWIGVYKPDPSIYFQLTGSGWAPRDLHIVGVS